MKSMIVLSLLLNVVVLVPVTYGIATSAQWLPSAYGAETAGLSILLAVYLAILGASVGLLFRPVPEVVATVLVLQVVYKVLTPFTVGSFANPVVVSNLGIAAFHCITLWLIFTRIGE